MQTITPFLWFDDNLGQALEFYAAIFTDFQMLDASRMGPDAPIFTATFEINGQRLMGLNGGPHFQFSEAISLFVSVTDQAEIDHLWNALADGGSTSQCGWLKDRFGISWQIVPATLGDLLGHTDRARADKAMQAMLKMTKLDIAELQAAFDS